MKTTARRLALMTGCSFLLVAASWAQTSSIEGEVKGEDGNPLKGALVRIEREDIKGNYRVKTNNRGHYFHAGLPLGTYKISLEVGGKVLDQVQGVRTSLGEATRVNFDLQQTRRRQEALRQAAQAGELTEEQRSSLTREQREAIEKQMQAQAQAMKKNKALNDAFNVAMAAKQAQQWDVAVENFEKAGEIDPEQHVIWANLAESYIGLGELRS
jgi:tetratricopeptide (TPR) repeat protein